MTYVEFFDNISSENVSACLTHVPNRVIYIGDNAKLMEKHIARYERIFYDRGCEIEFLYRTVNKNNLENAVSVLEELVETYDDCVFDVTGGEEILTLALGIVYARCPEKNIQIQKFNLRSNAIYDCDKDGNTTYQEAPSLTVEENVRIYGGDIVYGDVSEDKTYMWNLTPDFIEDVNFIWSVCRGNVRLWNTQIGVFAAAESVGTVSEDGLTTTAKIAKINHELKGHKASYKLIKGIVNTLLRKGLITALNETDGKVITISYKNEQVKKCLTKAGQALEMKVYLIAKFLADKDGNPMYHDVMNGVSIDWDGQFHNEETEEIYDTENEIDVVLMHNMIPIFISCKNGFVTTEELYKLNAVAERFGGRYSKKVLVATSIGMGGDAGEYFRQRATDMNIKVIEDVQNLEDPAFAKKLKNLWCV